MLIAGFTNDSTTLLQAGIRVIIFITLSLVIFFLATALKNKESTLRNTNQIQESVISNARVWLVALDSDGIIHLWNKAAEEISGYPSEEVIGKAGS